MTVHLSLTGRAFTGSIWGCANHPSGRCLGNCPNARRRAGWFAALDRLIPHPVYAWMGWIAVLSPGEQTFRELLPYIEEAYVFAKEKYNRRKRK